MKLIVFSCILAVALANDMYSQYDSPSYSAPAYNPPQPLYLPQGYVVAPPKPIELSPPKPTTTTFLIHNAEAPPKPSLPAGAGAAGLGGGLGGLGALGALGGA